MLRWAHDCRINLKGPPELLKSIQAATDRYQSENDYYMEFFGEKVVKSALSKDTLTWTDVWDSFRSWMGRSYGWDNLPKRLEARKKFEGSVRLFYFSQTGGECSSLTPGLGSGLTAEPGQAEALQPFGGG